MAEKQALISGVFTGASAEMIEYMRQDFLDTTGERVQLFEQSLSDGADLASLRYFAFEVKGQARNFGMPLLGIIAARLEDYLNALDHISEWSAAGINAFLDTMRSAIDGGIADDAEPSLIVRSLPARPRLLGVDDNDALDVEVMLVMEHTSQTTYVEREMQACGYRTTIVSSPFEAFESVIRTRPDMVIVSAVLPGLSGIDLATALATMPDTRNTPVAVLTSLDDDSTDLNLLPKSVPVIHRGDRFGDDLAKALSHHFLL
ncbi:MAG: Hpt domain-containing protein [Rhodospirillales bacterium]|nr:MAG: Hpt domain-containing protein [Rhodospirillales bacterium]